MGYYNRFTFKNIFSFKYVFRGIDYLDQISDFEINGNIVHAKIYGTKPYDVSFAINFFDKTIMFPKCNCPYTESHRNCKHILALMLYTDIYINGGSIEDLAIHFIANHIVQTLKVLNKTKEKVFLEDVKKMVINQDLNILDYDVGYKMPYLQLLKKVNLDQFREATEILIKQKVITIDKDDRVWTEVRSAKNYKSPYYSFFAKYSLLEGHGDYVYDYWEHDEYYDENQPYYYSKDVRELTKGINLNEYASLFVSDNLGILFDLKHQRLIFPDSDDYFDIYDCMDFPCLTIGNELVEFYISLINDEVLKSKIVSDYEGSHFKEEELPNNERTKYNKLKKNYIVGLATKYCLDNRINFYFD